jgi:hypothetical protein
MKSFIDNGHKYDLYSYDTPVVPQGIRVLDANEILPQSEVFYYRHADGRGSVAGFANLFRYRLLLLRGGWWVDTDVVCLSSQVPQGEIYLEREEEEIIGNAVLKFPRGHALVKALYECSCKAGKDIRWGETGPQLTSDLTKQMGLWDQARLREHAFSINWRDAFLLVTKSGRQATQERTRSASFLHLWNEVFRRDASIALHNPPNGSFLADLYIKHGVQRRFPAALFINYKLAKWQNKTRSFVSRASERILRLAGIRKLP